MIKVGICGGGFMGKMHAACHAALPNAKIVAVADVRKKVAEQIAGPHRAKAFSSAKELIAKADVDMVDICLPTHFHAEHVMLAAKRGLNCLCEKPMSRTLAESSRMVKAVRKARISFMVAHVIRFWPEYVVLKKYVDRKTLGKLRMLRLVRVSPRPTWAWKNWLDQGSLSGGAALDLHIHDADYVRYLLGDPAAIHSVGSKTAGVWDHILTNYCYRNIAVSAEGGWDLPPGYPFEMNFRAIFEKGTLFYSSLNTPMTLYRPSGKNSLVKVPQPKVKGGAGGKGGNITSLGGYFNEIQYFLNCLDRGRKPETATAEDAHDSVALVLREITSAARNTRRGK